MPGPKFCVPRGVMRALFAALLLDACGRTACRALRWSCRKREPGYVLVQEDARVAAATGRLFLGGAKLLRLLYERIVELLDLLFPFPGTVESHPHAEVVLGASRIRACGGGCCLCQAQGQLSACLGAPEFRP